MMLAVLWHIFVTVLALFGGLIVAGLIVGWIIDQVAKRRHTK